MTPYNPGQLLDRSPVTKSIAVIAFLLVLFVQYISFELFFVLFPSAYINTEVVQLKAIFNACLIVVCSVVLSFRGAIEKSKFAQKHLPYFVLVFFVYTLMILGYTIGYLSIVTGVVFGVAPLFCILIFDRKLTFWLLVHGGIAFIAAYLVHMFNIAAYAPMFTPAVDQTTYGKNFYIFCMLYFLTPHLFGVLIASNYLVTYWKARENEIRRLSLTDSLIDVANRRAINEHLEHSMLTAHYESPVSVILADIYFFKRINDTYGHHIGDRVLKVVGETLSSLMREEDQVGRYGGEEFLIVLPKTGLKEAVEIAERCRAKLEQKVIVDDKGQRIYVTASFGVYAANDSSSDLNNIIKEVDVQLYRAKDSGRNIVCYLDMKGSTSSI